MSGSSTGAGRAPADLDWVARLGGWLFRHRTSLPVPIAVVLLLAPPEAAGSGVVVSGVLLVAWAEALRLWAVHHIGTVSRTRSDRLGPLIWSGPFASVRNPLYLANIMLWVGFACSARLPWLVPLIALALALQYHAIVRWEERLLEDRLGDAYRAYAASVPRWWPRLSSRPKGPGAAFSWRETFFSERGTLLAIAVGYLLLHFKEFVMPWE